jgi:uncharacterized protein (TIGR03000 family)
MFRKAFTFGGLLLLSAATVLMTPGLSHAQRGGGGHAGGGGHFGGGGAHFGGGGAHFGGGHFGGYGRGFSRGGYGYGHRYGGYGYYPYYGFGYGYSPYYGGYSYDPGYYDSYPDTGSDLAYSPSYSGSTTDLAPTFAGSVSQSLYSPAQPDTVAHVAVRLPADARVWFQNAPMTSTGSLRQFESPLLAPGQPYTYDVRATWTENGHEVTQDQKVEVSAGGHVTVTFPVPANTTAPATTAKSG